MSLMNAALPRRWFQRSIRAPRHGPLTHLAAPVVSGERGLRFTELLFLGVLSLAYLLSVSSPVFGILMYHTPLNHFSLVLMVPVLLLHIVGLVINRPPTPWARLLWVCLPLMGLALYALVGSSVAKWVFKINETYLSFGIYLLLLPLYAALTADGERLRAWALALIIVPLLFSVAALIGEAARFGGRDSLHETEYLVIAGFLGLFYAVRSSWVKLLAVLMLLAVVVLNHKLTGYIIAAMALLHIALTAGWRRLLPEWRGAYGLGALVLGVALSVALTLLYFEFRDYLPSGNTEVRLSQYERAMQRFFESPVWGNAYLEGSGEVFQQAARALNIPTHSDVLDMLKHGGLIAFLLFAWGYGHILWLVNRACVATAHQQVLNAYFISARFFMVTALFTFSFNPLLLKGPFLIVIWASVGLALGMSLAVLKPAALKPAPTRPLR